MSEFIGSRISLISKSDIRYVGTLHEINSESSTVALEQVKSFGTEGRKNSPDEEVPASDAVYEYIVFRGSDVKDLRIEEAPKENKPPPPQMPNDPAILGSGSRPPPANGGPQGQGQPPFHQQPQYPPYNQYNQYQQQQFGGPGPRGPPGPGFHGPPPGGFNGYGPYGGPGGPGGPGMPPYGYPPPGQGFPPGPFPPHQQMRPGGPGTPGQGPPFQQQPPTGPRGAQQPGQQQPAQQREVPKPEVSAENAQTPSNTIQQAPTDARKQTEQQQQGTPVPQEGPRPPTESKPTPAQALASAPSAAPVESAKPTAAAPKQRGIIPAIPQMKQAQKSNAPAPATPSAMTSNGPPGQAAADAALQYQNATQAATAAVAAAMAKLPPMGGGGMPQKSNPTDGAMDNLTKKINEMRTDEHIKHSSQPGNGGFAAGNRGGVRGGRGPRGGARGGRGGHEGKAFEVPKTDFDFETSNARFNKQDLAKGAASTSSPLGTPLEGANGHGAELNNNGDGAAIADVSSPNNGNGGDVVVPPPAAPAYTKSSFFDNLSSEQKDRDEVSSGGRGGAQFGRDMRNQERARNLETFGLGSVEQGYRGGFRGRGRGRGRGFGGGYGNGRGGGGMMRGGAGLAGQGAGY